MKKNILTIGALLFVGVTMAQFAPPVVQTPAGVSTPAVAPAASLPQEVNGRFKPSAGDLTFELNVTPFAASPVSLTYLRTRKFLSDEKAARAGMTFSYKGNGSNYNVEYGVLPGIEKHFKGSEKLSPYIGAELIIAGRLTGSISAVGPDSALVTTTIKGKDGFFNFGLNTVIGCDYYFSKRIYVGVEAGYGMSLLSTSEVETTTTRNGGTTTILKQKGTSSIQVGPNFNSAFRFGFVF